MNLLKINEIEDIVAYAIIPYEILTHQQKVNLLIYFDFDIKKIFNSNIKEIKSFLRKKDNFNLNPKLYYTQAKEIIKKKNFLTIDSKYFPFECWKYEFDQSIKTSLLNNDGNYAQCLLLPFLLFYEGNPQILSLPKISIVGTRKPEEISINFTYHVVKQLKKVVVSGFANGIDHHAHLASIQNEIPTIAVFGCGVNIIYPKSNLELYKRFIGKEYLILSEFADGTIPKKYYFPIRNRIIAALGDEILCVQAGEKSGALITTKYAKELNKPILTFYPIMLNKFEGNKNLFYKQNAKLLYGINNRKFYIKNPEILSDENIPGKDEIEFDPQDIKFEKDKDLYLKINELSTEDLELLKTIYLSPFNSLEYYCQFYSKNLQNILASYQNLLEKNLIVIDRLNRIYPNYALNAIEILVK